MKILNCVHAANSQDEERIRKKPLRQLGADDLRQYGGDALLVWGNETDFKHFLPRIFELEALYGDEFLDPELALGKLRDAGWRDWSEAEQRGVERFLRALWEQALRGEPGVLCGLEMSSWLCGLASCEADIRPYLEMWSADESENAGINLCAFVADTNFAQPVPRATGFWAGMDETFDMVKGWVRSDGVRSKIRSIAATYPECAYVERAWVLLG